MFILIKTATFILVKVKINPTPTFCRFSDVYAAGIKTINLFEDLLFLFLNISINLIEKDVDGNMVISLKRFH